MKRRPITTAVLAASGLLVILTGCSGEDGTTATKTPTPSASAQETSEPTHTTYNECVEGHATIDAAAVEAGEPIELDDCADVSIVSGSKDGTPITIGAVENLLVEASDAEIEVDRAGHIIVPGSGNTITYSGEAEVQDLGKDNSITTR